VTSSANRGNRLAVVLSHPTQYYSPWFRWVSEHTELDFRVFYLWDFGVTHKRDPEFQTAFEWDVDLLSGYESEFVQNCAKRPGAEHFFGFNNPELLKRISHWKPTAVLLFGYKWYSHMRLIAWAGFAGIPMIFRGDSHLLGRTSPKLHARAALSLVFSRFASFLYVGVANREYFRAFGVPENRLFFSPHSVDGSLFNRQNPRHHEEARKLRSVLGIAPRHKVILFAGKLTEAKQPAALLHAFYRAGVPETTLVFVGDGPEKGKLEALALEQDRMRGSTDVRFIPFTNQSEMPSRYLLADLFVLPSRSVYETWGLAVNESMQMGVPCLVSSLVGCQRDLVSDGETGWVFDPGDPEALSRALSKALGDLSSEQQTKAIKANVADRIGRYGYPQTTDGLLEALKSVGP
jgi:glycosyltransferase involved in cell wall biosynthesis